MASLSGQVAVVTGASRGIGKGIALAFAAEGATVYITERTVTPGSYFITAELAQEYGVTDIDGKIIPSLRAERGAPIWSPV